MSNKIVLAVLLLLAFTVSVCFAGSPDDFNGYDNNKWGIASDDVRLVLLGYDLEVSFYEPIEKPEIVKIGSKNFRLKGIQYVFLNNQFGRVTITVDEISSQAVLQELIAVYGQPGKVKKLPSTTGYSWIGDSTNITMHNSLITIESRKLVEDQILKEGGRISDYP